MIKTITELWAWVAQLPDGRQSIPAAQSEGGLVLPLFGTNRAAMEAVRHLAQQVAEQEEGSVVRLCRFFDLEVVEELAANSTPEDG